MPDMTDQDKAAFEEAKKQAYEVEVHWDLHDRHKISFIDTDARDEYLYDAGVAYARQQDVALLERCADAIKYWQIERGPRNRYVGNGTYNEQLIRDIEARKAGR